jgi:hypothetical protein
MDVMGYENKELLTSIRHIVHEMAIGKPVVACYHEKSRYMAQEGTIHEDLATPILSVFNMSKI